MCVQDLLLHLVEHLQRHRFAMGLRTLCDVSEIVALHGHRLDWDSLALRAREWRRARTLSLVLAMCEDVLGMPLPAGAIDSLGPAPTARQLDNAVLMFRDTVDSPVLYRRPGVAVLLASRSPRRRLMALVGAAFPARDRLADIHGLTSESWRTYGYYPRHWLDLCRRYGGSLLRATREAERRHAARQALELMDWLEEEQLMS
jgi:hypothetical protein